MGGCGCGDYSGRWRFPGPDGKWYVASIGGGCRDCGTPIGLAIDLFDEQDMKDWDAEELPIIGGPDFPNFGIPIIDVDLFKKELGTLLSEAGVRPEKEYDSIKDQCGDLELHDALSGAAHETAAKFDAEIEAASKR